MELIKLSKNGESALVEPSDLERFLSNGWSEKGTKPSKEVKRARKDDGTLVGDNPKTPENEAWVGGKAPARGKRKKT